MNEENSLFCLTRFETNLFMYADREYARKGIGTAIQYIDQVP